MKQLRLMSTGISGILFSAVIFSGALMSGSAVYANTELNDKTLRELLEQVRQLRRDDEQANWQRERQFTESRDQQQKLLEQARQENRELEKRSETLETGFQSNEVELQSLETIYKQRVGSLIELSGVMRRAAGQLHSQLSDTFLSLQIEQWDQKLMALKSNSGLPTVEEIEMLWDLFLQYLVVQAKGFRLNTDIIYADGDSREHEIVSVGGFTAFAEGRFLSYLPETRKFVMLDRQPAAHYLSAADDFINHDSSEASVIPVPIDPSRGVLLSLLVSSPTLLDRLHQGGLIAYIILIIAVIGVLLSVERIVVLGRVTRAVRTQARNPDQVGNNPLGRVFSTYKNCINLSVETLELKLEEAIIGELPKLNRGLATLKVFAVIAPLLGLLGTVTGMIETFQAITLFGTGDPKLMSSGISQALVTTALGLMVAIPIILFHVYLGIKSRSIREVLEEQSAGLMAEYAHAREK